MHRYMSGATLILHSKEVNQLRIRTHRPRKKTYGESLSLDSKIRPAIESADKDGIALVMAWASYQGWDRGAPPVGPFFRP